MTPSASRTSADPQALLTDRFPALAAWLLFGADRQDRGCRAPVDGVGPVPVGSDNVQEFLVSQIDGVASVVHRLDHPSDLFGSFALLSQKGQEGTHLNLVGSLEDFLKGRLGFLSRQRAFSGNQGLDVGFEGSPSSVTTHLKRRFRSFRKCFVGRKSGCGCGWYGQQE